MKTHELSVWFWLPLCILLCIGTACKDEKETDEPLSSTSYYEGELRFVNFHRKMIPGAYECYFTNREDGSELVVAAIVYSEEGEVVFIPESPVRTGDYYFNRAVLVKSDQPANETEVGLDVPLGCQVSITNDSCILKEEEEEENLECFGSGTEEDPYRISSYVHLKNLMDLVNSTEENNKKYGNKYYIQTANISLKVPCANLNNGWNSIGNHITRPFTGHYDGQGYSIKNMTVKRTGNIVPQPAGLFGIIINGSIRNVIITNSEIQSDYAVAGMLAGAVSSTGNMRLTSGFSNCKVDKSCHIKAPYLVGGLVGGVNQNARLVMSGCTNDMALTVDYQGVGGLIGAAFAASTVTLDSCSNTGQIIGKSGITGGLIGSADTLLVNGCKNSGAIQSEKGAIGTGGLVGGGLNVITTFSENRGKVSGDREVGGIIGSTARRSSDKIYADTHIYATGNYGDITGNSEVGGLVGAAQTLISGSYNFGSVVANEKNTGGLAGLGGIAVIVGSANDGDVKCYGSDEDSFTGGIIGSAQDYLITGCSNYGNIHNVNGKGTAGGIIGGCDLMGVISYCGNMGSVKADKGSAGGIIGRAGKPWNMNSKKIADMVVSTVVSITSIGLSAALPAGSYKQKMSSLDPKSLRMTQSLLSFNTLTTINDIYWTTANGILSEAAVSRQRMESLEYRSNSELESFHDARTKMLYFPSSDQVNRSTAFKVQQLLQENFLKRISTEDATYYDRVNEWRNDIENQMHSKEVSREIAEHVGETIAFIGDIIGFCPVPNPVTIVFTAIVTIYNLIMNLTDFSYNRVGILQSYNYGDVKVASGQYGGGIAGELHDYGRMMDCVNIGIIDGNDSGILFGKGGHLPEVNRSGNLQPQEQKFINNTTNVDVLNIKNVFNMTGKGDEIHRKDTYNMLDFNGQWIWDADVQLPMIGKSQFE